MRSLPTVHLDVILLRRQLTHCLLILTFPFLTTLDTVYRNADDKLCCTFEYFSLLLRWMCCCAGRGGLALAT